MSNSLYYGLWSFFWLFVINYFPPFTKKDEILSLYEARPDWLDISFQSFWIILYTVFAGLFLILFQQYRKRFRVRQSRLPRRWQLLQDIVIWGSLFLSSSFYLIPYSELYTEIYIIRNPIIPEFQLPFEYGTVLRIWYWTLGHKYNIEFFYKVVQLLYRTGRDDYDITNRRDLKGGIYLRRCPDYLLKFIFFNLLLLTLTMFIYCCLGITVPQNGFTLFLVMAHICLLDEFGRELFWRKRR